MRHNYHGEIWISQGPSGRLRQLLELLSDYADCWDALLLGLNRVVDTPRRAGPSSCKPKDGPLALIIKLLGQALTLCFVYALTYHWL